MKIQPFHLAIPVKDLDETRTFYREVIGCEEGRSSDHWVDFNFFGHQFVIHLAEGAGQQSKSSVDSHDVPVPHFGVVLEWDHWHEFRDRLIEKGVEFQIEPQIRFKGLSGEQCTMFFYDPSGNALEFKAFQDITQLFK